MPPTPRRSLLFLAPLLGAELFWGLASAVAYMPTVMTGYIRFLGYSNQIVAVMPALYWAAYSVAQLMSLRVIPPGPKAFGRVVLVFVIGSCFPIALGLFLFAYEVGPLTSLLLLLTSFTAFIYLVGVIDPHYIQYAYCATTDGERGRFFGLRSLLLGAGGLAGSLYLLYFMDKKETADQFHQLFLLSGILYVGAAASLSQFKYRDAPNNTFTERTDVRTFRELLSLLAINRRLVVMFFAGATFVSAVGGFSLYANYIIDAIGEDGELRAQLTLTSWVGHCLFSVVLGWWADRVGYLKVYIAVCVLFSAGTLMLIWPHGKAWCLAAYLLASCWLPGLFVAGFNLTQEYAEGFNPSETMILYSVMMLPARLVLPLLVGSLMDFGAGRTAMLLCGLLPLCAAVLALKTGSIVPIPKAKE